jgi:hypothetical protein
MIEHYSTAELQAYCRELLASPDDIYAAGYRAFCGDTIKTQHAQQYLIRSADFQAFRRDYLANLDEDLELPSRVEYLMEVWGVAKTAMFAGDRLAALKLYAESRGFLAQNNGHAHIPPNPVMVLKAVRARDQQKALAKRMADKT